MSHGSNHSRPHPDLCLNPKKILDSFGVEVKANAKIPFDSDRDWIRLTVGPGLIETPYIEEILKKEK